MAVAMDRLLDLSATTLNKVPSNEYKNLMVKHSYMMEQFMLDDLKPRDMSGKKVTFNAIIKGDSDDSGALATDNGQGRYGPYDIIPLVAQQYQTTGEVPWAYYVTHWILSSQELKLNSGKEAFVNLLESTKEGCSIRFANMLENQFWSTTSYEHESSERPAILGLPYWITDDGYHINDAGGTNGTSVGGIDPTDSDFNDSAGVNRWRNQFKSIGAGNALLDAFDYMWVKCRFKAPQSVKLNTARKFKKFSLVMGIDSFLAYKKLMRLLDEEFDVSNPTYNNIPIEHNDSMVARADGNYETYFVNKDTFKCFVEKGNNFRKEAPFKPQNQDARAQYVYLWPAMACDDRGSNGKVFGYGDLVGA